MNKVLGLLSSVGIAACMSFAAGQATAASDQRLVTIGTGGVTGVYYPTGGAICRLVNENRKEHGIRCSVESTGGSVYNVNAIRAGELNMGIIQSDWQYHAYDGTSGFADRGRFEGLRAVFSVHPEPFTIVARADAGVRNFQDLKGKRVNVGDPDSGNRGTIEVVMAAMGWTMDDFALISELKASEQSKALCRDRIDAMVYTVGHPSSSISEATTTCNSVLVNVTGPEIDRLVAENDFYRTATVPGGMYRGNPDDTMTFGVGATFVSSTATPADVVYEVVKAVFSDLERFRKMHPALYTLDAGEMIADGLSAPLHDGAMKYYREAGLME